MNKELINEYLSGGVAGMSQVIIGYPLDTIKTNIQNGNYNKLSINQMFKGIKYPMMASVVSNIAFFGNYDLLYNYTNSIWISGGITGLLGSFILNPFEIRKVRYQYALKLNNNYNSSIYGGLKYTIMRESIGNAFYFSVYHYCHNYLQYNSFISGGFAGLNSWFWSYPLDVIKTKKQLNLSLSFKHIIKTTNLWNGLTIALIRGFIVNGFSFWIYDNFKIYMFND